MGGTEAVDEYVAGAVAGMAGLIVGHPFDTTKVQMQTQHGGTVYKGTWDAIKHINRHGLTSGFYRGMGFPLLSYGAVNSVFFGVYGHTINRIQNGEDRLPTKTEIVTAGAVGGFAQLFVACPVEVVKVVLQSQITYSTVRKPTDTYFRGPIECSMSILKSRGITGLYTGFWIQAIRDVPASALYFLIYEVLNEHMIRKRWTDSRGIIANLFSGGMAGVISWLAIMPFDVVKSNYQADTDRKKYRSVTHCVIETYKRGGIKMFYTGSFATAARAFPTNGVIFLVHMECLGVLGKFRKRQTQEVVV